MKKHTILSLALFAVLLSCQNAADKNKDKDSLAVTISSPFSVKDMSGVYTDTIPCADCAGIVTTLRLRKDSNFIMQQEYVGLKDSSGEHIFYQLGKWSLLDSTLKLNEITEGPRQFKVVNPGELNILDNEGSVITETKLNYTLHKKEMLFIPKKNIPVRGMFMYFADVARIKLCAWGKDFPVALTPASVKMETEYGKIQKADQQRILAEVEGRLEMRPGMEEGKKEETYVIYKFNKFLPADSCK
ncbi:MAG: copper resistance protein NlpE N-terminal domain-containing protein [Filimonas sp.]|nr:copper resistance protein NlpE N-terminal domain-containing protein [Filimonas sp.]